MTTLVTQPWVAKVCALCFAALPKFNLLFPYALQFKSSLVYPLIETSLTALDLPEYLSNVKLSGLVVDVASVALGSAFSGWALTNDRG